MILSTMLLASIALSPALARGGHGRSGHQHGSGATAHGSESGVAGGRQHGNDAEVKAAADENDRLLNNKIKSICRGC
jgi:hypothetical protein